MQILHSRQTRAGLLIFILGIGIVIAISPFAIGLLGSGVLYVLFARVYRRMRRFLPKDLAATITLILAILVVVLPLVWLVGLLVDQAPETLKAVQSGSVLDRKSVV